MYQPCRGPSTRPKLPIYSYYYLVAKFTSCGVARKVSPIRVALFFVLSFKVHTVAPAPRFSILAGGCKSARDRMSMQLIAATSHPGVVGESKRPQRLKLEGN